MITLVVASAENGVIGNENTIPWKMRSNMRHFKSLTTSGKENHLIMGRNTFESMGSKQLPGRIMHVITSSPDKIETDGETIFAYSSVEEAVEFLNSAASVVDGLSVWLIGGASVYKYALNKQLADKIVHTTIHGEVPGDTFFSIPLHGWKKEFSKKSNAGEKDDFNYTITEWSKIRA